MMSLIFKHGTIAKSDALFEDNLFANTPPGDAGISTIEPTMGNDCLFILSALISHGKPKRHRGGKP